MKGALALILLILNSAFGFGQKAEFFVKTPVHKFPKTAQGVLLKHDFEVVNTGDVPLVISHYEVSCSCTKVTLPGPVPPGGTATISVEFDTAGKYYQQDREIILTTNARRQTANLRFKVFVVVPKE